MENQWSRREFLKTTAAAVVLGTAEKALGAGGGSLPKRRLGMTGEMVSCIGFGSGTRFCSIENEDAAPGAARESFRFGHQLLRYRRFLYPARHRTAERKTARNFYQSSTAASFSCHQDRSARPLRRAPFGGNEPQVFTERLS